MKIGIDVSRANDEKKTGVGWYVYYVVQELKKQTPRDVEVVLYTRESLKGELAELPDGWTQKVLKWPPKRLWTQIRLSWEMLFHAPDVLFIPSHVFPLIHPKKTVMTVHDIAAVKFPKSYNWFERWYSVWSARFALKNLWKVIVPSNFVKKELTSAFGDENLEKIDVIYHGYDKRYRMLDEYETNIRQMLDKYSLGKSFIMSIGRLEEKKNTWRIVEAFDKLRDVGRETRDDLQLLLVGKPGFGYEKVKEEIERSEYKDDIIVPGWVENEDLPALMNAAEVFVFPSLYEGFGIPVLEALACGTPVVASRGSCLGEVGGEACVYVDADSVEDIFKGIVELLKDEGRGTRDVERGLEHVKNFSWEKCARETIEVLVS